MNLHRKEKKISGVSVECGGHGRLYKGKGRKEGDWRKTYSAIKTIKNNNKFGHGDTQKTEQDD